MVSIRINTEVAGKIHSFIGVRHGDPLSPLLLVLAQHVLSSNFKLQLQTGNMSPYKLGPNELSISHLFYAYDVLVFTNGSELSLKNLMQLLQVYSHSSGQLINTRKADFMWRININGASLFFP